MPRKVSPETADYYAFSRARTQAWQRLKGDPVRLAAELRRLDARQYADYLSRPKRAPPRRAKSTLTRAAPRGHYAQYIDALRRLRLDVAKLGSARQATFAPTSRARTIALRRACAQLRGCRMVETPTSYVVHW